MAWQRTYVRPSVLSHTHYINSDLCRYFLICGYGIFPSLWCTISYPRTMYTYDLWIYFSSYFVSTLYRHFSLLLCIHALSCPVSFCLQFLHVGLNLFLVWPNLNHISNKAIQHVAKVFLQKLPGIGWKFPNEIGVKNSTTIDVPFFTTTLYINQCIIFFIILISWIFEPLSPFYWDLKTSQLVLSCPCFFREIIFCFWFQGIFGCFTS